MIMNNKRCFSFGCSYTNHCWVTWADFVGSNFDIYINFGRGGASNTFIMNQVFEQNDSIHFKQFKNGSKSSFEYISS
jgi:hypothetical protein